MARILVVDDEADIRELLVGFLTGEGYEVEVAWSGREALTKIQVQSPDLVLLDVKLEKESGVELLQEIREQNKPLKVIMVSGCEEGDYWPQAEKLGAVAYVSKPFDLARFSELIQKILNGGG